ncbi:MAG: thioredoxin-dependent thiol peroxidase [Phycisphaerae bacterium]
MTIAENAPAPVFSLPATTGTNISLAALRGKIVVLYFYPKDDTPGCTKEACNFRDGIKDLEKEGAVVLGVSPDDVVRHEKFQQKYHLPFPLLADADHAVAEKYGVWKEKSMYGKKYMGIERTTFIINAEGRITKSFRKVKVENHLQEVLTALQS